MREKIARAAARAACSNASRIGSRITKCGQRIRAGPQSSPDIEGTTRRLASGLLGSNMAAAEQIELALPARSANSILEDKIAALVAQLTEELNPFKRVELSASADRLRKIRGVA